MFKKLSPLEIQVRNTIREYGMLTKGDSVIIAVSGGADSVALLLCLNHLARELQISISVAHLNHRIRGSEADADQEFVREISASLGVAFITETIEVKEEASKTKENLEQLARKLRYDFLRRAAAEITANKIAVGHSMNDQAETVLFRFLRGSGIQGLSAIHPILNGMIVRPLLGCTRSRIIQYLKSQGAQYREDSTNQDLSYTRNRLRQELIPSLEKTYNPNLIQTLSRTARMAYETWDFMESEGVKAFEAIHRTIPEGISLQINEIKKLHPALQKQVLRFALKCCLGSLSNIAAAHIESLLELCNNSQSGSQIQLPGKGIASRQFDQLIMTPIKESPGDSRKYSYELQIPGQCAVPEIGGIFNAGICKSQEIHFRRSFGKQAFLDASALPQRLTVRSKQPGDRYGGSSRRKVKKMLIDRKIPLAQREFLPMVVAGDHVIWIPGFKPAKGYESSPESATFIILDFLTGLQK
jgi:tRNA(Ile)-lysidine synthase